MIERRMLTHFSKLSPPPDTFQLHTNAHFLLLPHNTSSEQTNTHFSPEYFHITHQYFLLLPHNTSSTTCRYKTKILKTTQSFRVVPRNNQYFLALYVLAKFFQFLSLKLPQHHLNLSESADNDLSNDSTSDRMTLGLDNCCSASLDFMTIEIFGEIETESVGQIRDLGRRND